MKLNLLGTIGTGKTTLGEVLSKRTGVKFIVEEFSDNPFIEPFYKDIASGGNGSEYIFKLQLFFLAKYMSQGKRLESEESYILDAGPLTGIVFVKAQTELGQMTQEEHDLYISIWKVCFLELEILKKDCRNIILDREIKDNMSMIESRGREYEKGMPEFFIKTLKRTYLDLPSILEKFGVSFEIIKAESGETPEMLADKILNI